MPTYKQINQRAKEMRDNGYTAVLICGHSKESAQTIRATLRAAGIEYLSRHDSLGYYIYVKRENKDRAHEVIDATF